MGTNLTHYNSIALVTEDPEELSPEYIEVYGNTEGAFDTPETFGMIHKYVGAVMTTDDFSEWDYTDIDSVESLKIWNSDGTALLTTGATIDYCYANIAVEVEPVITDEGDEFTLGFVGAASVFNVYNTETGEYVGSTFGKVIAAESADDNFIVTIPFNLGFSFSEDAPDGYAIVSAEYIMAVYENEDTSTQIFKMQPFRLNQPE